LGAGGKSRDLSIAPPPAPEFFVGPPPADSLSFTWLDHFGFYLPCQSPRAPQSPVKHSRWVSPPPFWVLPSENCPPPRPETPPDPSIPNPPFPGPYKARPDRRPDPNPGTIYSAWKPRKNKKPASAGFFVWGTCFLPPKTKGWQTLIVVPPRNRKDHRPRGRKGKPGPPPPRLKCGR